MFKLLLYTAEITLKIILDMIQGCIKMNSVGLIKAFLGQTHLHHISTPEGDKTQPWKFGHVIRDPFDVQPGHA